MKIDLKKGDEILVGKWQNKKEKVKSVGKNELGQPTVNDKPMLKFRIKKLMPKKETNESINIKNKQMKIKLFEDFEKNNPGKVIEFMKSKYPIIEKIILSVFEKTIPDKSILGFSDVDDMDAVEFLETGNKDLSLVSVKFALNVDYIDVEDVIKFSKELSGYKLDFYRIIFGVGDDDENIDGICLVIGIMPNDIINWK